VSSDPFGLVLKRLAAMPDVDRMLGEFVAMSGVRATVNLGEKSVAIPCSGWYPPVPGMIVQVERRNGQLIVTGPATQNPPIGQVTAGGSPKCTVTAGGVSYLLNYRSGYVPTIGDDVEINWATGIVQGKITGSSSDPAPTQKPGGTGGAFSGLVVFAEDSGSYRGGWWTNDVYGSDNNVGAWFHGTRIQSALKGANVSKIEIYLNPRLAQYGPPSVGLHNSNAKPGGGVSVHDQIALEPRSDWVTLPASWGNYLRDNTGSIGVTPGGYTIWRGTASDRYSGALRFAGVR